VGVGGNEASHRKGAEDAVPAAWTMSSRQHGGCHPGSTEDAVVAAWRMPSLKRGGRRRGSAKDAVMAAQKSPSEWQHISLSTPFCSVAPPAGTSGA
jgi:hypothetical protein